MHLSGASLGIIRPQQEGLLQEGINSIHSMQHRSYTPRNIDGKCWDFNPFVDISCVLPLRSIHNEKEQLQGLKTRNSPTGRTMPRDVK